MTNEYIEDQEPVEDQDPVEDQEPVEDQDPVEDQSPVEGFAPLEDQNRDEELDDGSEFFDWNSLFEAYSEFQEESEASSLEFSVENRALNPSSYPGYYISGTYSGGDFTIYVPLSYSECLAYDGSNLYNIGSSSFNLMVSGVEGLQSYSFPSMETPYYRWYVDREYKYDYLSSVSIDDTNISLLGYSKSAIFDFGSSTLGLVCAVFLGVIVCKLFMMR